MITVQHTSTLFYYDGPQVIEARDRIGGHYVGVAVGSEEERFMLVGVPPQRLQYLRTGVCDLRTLLLENSVAGWWLTADAVDLSKPMKLTPGAGDLDALGYLPDEGFLMQPILDADDTLTAEASVALPSVNQLARALQVTREIEKLQAELASILGGEFKAVKKLAKAEKDPPPARKKPTMSREAKEKIVAAHRLRLSKQKQAEKKS